MSMQKNEWVEKNVDKIYYKKKKKTDMNILYKNKYKTQEKK